MKIKLVLIDTFTSDEPPEPLRYYVQDSHIDRWQYTPKSSEKVIETNFHMHME